jgi:hypothetical protein
VRDELATVLRLVAEGKLSAEEATPIIDALTRGTPPAPPPAPPPPPAAPGQPAGGRAAGRRVRIQVSERGRRVVDLRVPLAFAAFAARAVPGIPTSYADLIEQAVESETAGTIVDAEDDKGDGVLISIE